MPTLEKFNKTHIDRFVLPLQASMKPGSQQYFWHPGVRGLGLKLTPKKAVYVVQRRVKDGPMTRDQKNKRLVIGDYRGITVEEAEAKASALRQDMREGKDPVAEKKAVVAASKTLQEVLDEYLEKYNSKLRPTTQNIYRGAIRRCFSDWQAVAVTKITENMVADRHIRISNSNGPRGKGEAHANQAMRVLRTLFNFAMLEYKDAKGQPLVTSNPVLGLKARRLWNENKKRKDFIADDDLSEWYTAVMQLDNATIRDYMLLCLFTGLRRGEASRLTWDNVKLLGQKPILRIPAADTKTNSEHVLPLSSFLVALLVRRNKARQSANVLSIDKTRRIDNNYVFPGEKPGSCIVEPKRAIAKVIELTKKARFQALGDEAEGVDFSMHALRRTFSNVAGRLDIAYYKHKALMNHSVKSDVTGANYLELTVEDLREPMEKICQHICKAAKIESAEPSQAQA
jgi:integrase